MVLELPRHEFALYKKFCKKAVFYRLLKPNVGQTPMLWRRLKLHGLGQTLIIFKPRVFSLARIKLGLVVHKMLQKLKRLDRNVMLCFKPSDWMGRKVLFSGVNNPPCIRLATVSNIAELAHVQ